MSNPGIYLATTTSKSIWPHYRLQTLATIKNWVLNSESRLRPFCYGPDSASHRSSSVIRSAPSLAYHFIPVRYRSPLRLAGAPLWTSNWLFLRLWLLRPGFIHNGSQWHCTSFGSCFSSKPLSQETQKSPEQTLSVIGLSRKTLGAPKSQLVARKFGKAGKSIDDNIYVVRRINSLPNKLSF